MNSRFPIIRNLIISFLVVTSFTGLLFLLEAMAELFSNLCWTHYLNPTVFVVHNFGALIFLILPILLIVLLKDTKNKLDTQYYDILFSRFPFFKMLYIAQLVGVNILLLVSITTLHPIKSFNRLMVLSADYMGQYEIAEKLYSYSDRNWAGTYYQASNHLLRNDLSGADHSRFINAIAEIYGAQSNEMAENLIDYSIQFYQQKEFCKAEEALLKSQDIFEKLGDCNELRSMHCLAILRKKWGDNEGVHEVLLTALEKVKTNTKVSLHDVRNFEEICTDPKLKAKFTSFLKKSPAVHPQYLHDSLRARVGTSTIHWITPFFEVFGGILVISIVVYTLSIKKTLINECISRIKTDINDSGGQVNTIALLSDLITLELSRKNYDEVQKNSQRLLELIENQN